MEERWANPPAALPAPTAETQVTKEKPTRSRPPAPAPETPTVARMVLEIDISVKLASESNCGGRLREKIQRKGRVKQAIAAALPKLAEPFPLPVVVTITRLGGKQLDKDDNFPRACKPVKDVLAEYLGVQDTGRDPRVRWRFAQKPAWAAGVRIKIAHGGE